MTLSHLFLHVTTLPSEPAEDFDPRCEVSIHEYRIEEEEGEKTVTIQIPDRWIEAYLDPFIYHLLGDDGKDIHFTVLALLGKEGRSRFTRLIEEAIEAIDSQLYSKQYKDGLEPLSDGFKAWIEENYLELMKEDSRNAEIRAAVEVTI